MRCSEWGEWMSLHLDGLLSQEQAQQLQTHVTRCQACSEQWATVSWLSSLLKAEPVATPAPGFAARVAVRLQRREARRRRVYSGLGVCIGSVGLWALVGVALLLVLLWQPSFRAVLLDVALPMANSLLSILAVLGKALCSVGYALATRPAALLVLGYAVLALALTMFWTRMVFRRWERVLQ